MLMLAAIAANMLQHRLVWSGESLKPKFSKISPMEGAKRIFGKQAVANFAKGLFKLVALGSVMTIDPVAGAASAWSRCCGSIRRRCSAWSSP